MISLQMVKKMLMFIYSDLGLKHRKIRTNHSSELSVLTKLLSRIAAVDISDKGLLLSFQWEIPLVAQSITMINQVSNSVQGWHQGFA